MNRNNVRCCLYPADAIDFNCVHRCALYTINIFSYPREDVALEIARHIHTRLFRACKHLHTQIYRDKKKTNDPSQRDFFYTFNFKTLNDNNNNKCRLLWSRIHHNRHSHFSSLCVNRAAIKTENRRDPLFYQLFISRTFLFFMMLLIVTSKRPVWNRKPREKKTTPNGWCSRSILLGPTLTHYHPNTINCSNNIWWNLCIVDVCATLPFLRLSPISPLFMFILIQVLLSSSLLELLLLLVVCACTVTLSPNVPIRIVFYRSSW